NIGGDGLPDGYNGIVCQTANNQGCTINDAALKGGVSSLMIQQQEGIDLDVEDFGSVSLTSAPVFGTAPTGVGFETCKNKPDVSATFLQAILLNGEVTATLNNATVQCIAGDGIVMQSTANGSPTLSMSSSTITNTELGLDVQAGTATLSNCTLWY